MSIRKQRVRRLVLVAYAALVCAAASSQTLNPALYLPIAASVVRVVADREQGGLSVGSGVTVAPSVVATSCHVVRDAVDVRIAGGGATLNADGEHADLRRDVCFLRVPDWNGKPVAFASASEVRPGAMVAALGFTGGAPITPRFGEVLALHRFDEASVIESNAPFNSGSSGGGLFDARGALIGLLTFRLRNSEVSYYSVPVQWVRERLPGEGQWASIQPLRESAPFWQGEPEELPYFMRAKALEAQHSWARLLELTAQWAAANPLESEPLAVRARALQEMHQPRAAAATFGEAAALSPEDPSIWHGLAMASAQAGDAEAARRAAARLDALDQRLAATVGVER
jgi:hypothetical protein